MYRLSITCATSNSENAIPRRQSHSAEVKSELLQCGDDIQSLQRFVGAQAIALQKILKKYKRWTGSSTLGSRFRSAFLSRPTNFTRQNYSLLYTEYTSMLSRLETTFRADPNNTVTPHAGSPTLSPYPSERPSVSENKSVQASQQTRYWNEYDDGSGSFPDTYWINIDNPSTELNFWGVAIAISRLTIIDPITKWRPGERRERTTNELGPLLASHVQRCDTTR